VSGTIALRDADVQTHAGAPLVKAGRLAVDLDRIEPLAHRAHVKSIELEGSACKRCAEPTALNLATAFLPEAARATPPASKTAAVQTPPPHQCHRHRHRRRPRLASRRRQRVQRRRRAYAAVDRSHSRMRRSGLSTNSRRPGLASSKSARSTWISPTWPAGDKPGEARRQHHDCQRQTIKHTGELASSRAR
jgi:hypothetical protein